MKEVFREAVRKEQIVPGKIRVISIFPCTDRGNRSDNSSSAGRCAEKRPAVQEHLAEEVLRFHVLANSDSRKDQAVKLEVRDAVLSYLKEVLPEGMDVKETTSVDAGAYGGDPAGGSAENDRPADAADSQCGGDDMLFPGSDLWRCHISCRKLQDPEDELGKRQDITGGAYCIRICVFWIQQMQYFLKRENNS